MFSMVSLLNAARARKNATTARDHENKNKNSQMRRCETCENTYLSRPMGALPKPAKPMVSGPTSMTIIVAGFLCHETLTNRLNHVGGLKDGAQMPLLGSTNCTTPSLRAGLPVRRGAYEQEALTLGSSKIFA